MREQGADTIGVHDRHGHLTFPSSKGNATSRRVDVRFNVREWRGKIALRVFPGPGILSRSSRIYLAPARLGVPLQQPMKTLGNARGRRYFFWALVHSE